MSSLSYGQQTNLIQYAEANCARRIDVRMKEALWKLALQENRR